MMDALSFLFYFFSKMITPKSIFWTTEKEDEWAGLLQHLQNMSSYPLTAGCWVTYKTIAEKQEWDGMSSSVLGPAWQLLSPMTVINLHVTALPSFPNKRETLFQMDFTTCILFSNEFSWLKLLRHQQTFRPSWCTPSERRKVTQVGSAGNRRGIKLYYVLHHWRFDHPGS